MVVRTSLLKVAAFFVAFVVGCLVCFAGLPFFALSADLVFMATSMPIYRPVSEREQFQCLIPWFPSLMVGVDLPKPRP